MARVYLIGSLKNRVVINIANALEALGYEVFDNWMAAGPEADDYWQRYEQERNRSYADALRGIAAEHVFSFDKRYLDAADIGILVLPAGKSGHLELGYIIGRGKRGIVLFDGEPERWDVMYLLAQDIFFSVDEMLDNLKTHGMDL
jgi:hypothetical protein